MIEIDGLACATKVWQEIFLAPLAHWQKRHPMRQDFLDETTLRLDTKDCRFDLTTSASPARNLKVNRLACPTRTQDAARLCMFPPQYQGIL